jgi:cytosine/adenosine deaminase-related metal-dependent hydrolase
LEHSALEGLTTSQPFFAEWVKEVVREQSSLSSSDVLAGMHRGSDTLLRGGTTTLADHAHPDAPAFETSLRRIVFWEVLGAQEGRARESLEKAYRRTLKEGGYVSPHSLYAVHEEILEEMFQKISSLQSIHLLESSDENQFFRTQSGPLVAYVRERGGDLSFPFSSPVSWLAAKQALLLLVHGNYLNPSEIAALRGSKASVIHCPGSHRFFGHKPFPMEDLRKAGVNVALGTDGLASNEGLSMLREMRLLREEFPEVTEEEVLAMATIQGAKALGMEKDIGSIEVGKKADLIAVPTLDAERVVFSMIDGKIILHHV